MHYANIGYAGATPAATALLDRLLHHAIVIQIDGASYRLRQHAGLIPENSLVRPQTSAHAAPAKRRGRPPKNRVPDHHPG
ncbi:ATP-binding protein [Caenispirillum bisanense]|uniref:ATP-binding protein n=1 Tax=Caenispirillum bisanense TaxID=414052 RepID=UPI0039F6E07A